jgi:hypothetical protein
MPIEDDVKAISEYFQSSGEAKEPVLSRDLLHAFRQFYNDKFLGLPVPYTNPEDRRSVGYDPVENLKHEVDAIRPGRGPGGGYDLVQSFIPDPRRRRGERVDRPLHTGRQSLESQIIGDLNKYPLANLGWDPQRTIYSPYSAGDETTGTLGRHLEKISPEWIAENPGLFEEIKKFPNLGTEDIIHFSPHGRQGKSIFKRTAMHEAKHRAFNEALFDMKLPKLYWRDRAISEEDWIRLLDYKTGLSTREDTLWYFQRGNSEGVGKLTDHLLTQLMENPHIIKGLTSIQKQAAKILKDRYDIHTPIHFPED